jgi:hypothetical protein
MKVKMQTLISDQRRHARYIVEQVSSIPAGTQKLSAEDDYSVLMAPGMWSYADRARLWCTYDHWTKEEAARLLSGILPANDERGAIFDWTYWSEGEKVALGPNHATYFIFKLFKTNFKCVEHVTEILVRSPLGDSASPKEWAEYARAKGLLPHQNYFTDVDNSPLLCLLEPGDNRSDVSQSRRQTPGLESKSIYTTPLLAILRAAVDQFFHPRRSTDAKSEEVVEWIIAEIDRAGLPESRKVAEAMFTIIKPNDHDPKKKRGNPL